MESFKKPETAFGIVRGFFPVLLILLTFQTISARAEDNKVVLNFRDADVKAVVAAIGDITGKTFILDPRVKGQMNIISSRPVQNGLVYEIFLSAIKLHGFVAIESAGVVKIVPEGDGKTQAGRVEGKDVESSGDRLITQIYPLAYEPATQLVPILTPLVSKNNSLTAYPAANVLVVTDYASNIKRIDQIIGAIDKPNTGRMEVLSFKHVSALDFAEIVKKTILPALAAPVRGQPVGGQAPGALRERFSMVPDTRTNSLIIRSDNPSLIDQVKRLAAKLDVPTTSAGNVHVMDLHYADPEKLAKMLNGVIANQPTKGSDPAVSISAGVQADTDTKSLIIVAPDHIYKVLRAVAERLDTRRDQIYVEALIAEVRADKAAEFGIQWQSLRGLDAESASRVMGVGGVNIGGTGATIGEVTGNIGEGGSFGGGLSVGIINGTITLPNGTVVPNLMALARAMETDADANILSTPTLLAMDNEEAKILVGQNVPFITGSYAPSTGGASNTVNPFQTIERKDIGLTLKIKPRITESGTIRLIIYQEISSLLPVTIQTGASDVVTNKRSLESTVLVEDGQIVALGGLIQDNVSVKEAKVPVLGDIPLLGLLFRYDSRQHTKTNLMVFLRPKILREPDDALDFTRKNYNHMLKEQSEFEVYPYTILPDMPSPTSPDFQYKLEKDGDHPEEGGEEKKESGAEKEDNKEEEDIGWEF